jgi:large subunit ribosomal protein L30
MVAKKKTKADAAKIKIQYYRSVIAFPTRQKEIVRSLGLHKLNQVVERPDTPSMRGAVAKVPHLIRIIE